ncbi:MAG: prolyl oligopeptidase family serine peptidase, partial [Pyrinomonadaceae bacterium]
MKKLFSCFSKSTILTVLLIFHGATFVGAQAVQNPGSARFTIEQIMSAPFPSDLIAAPTGGRIAWIMNARGVRNIWIAEGADFKARAITNYAEDDGQEIGDLAWMPNGQGLIYVRGGDFENDGSNPNPLSNVQVPEQAIWFVSINGSQPKKLAEGKSPGVSPDGSRLAFTNKTEIWSVKTDGTEKASLLIHAKGNCNNIRWSPDGSKLAFVNSRGDHSFIAIYDLTSKLINFLDPSVDRDNEPVWSSDSRSIAFIRIPTSSEAFAFGPKRTGQPWSIRLADVISAKSRELWRADEGEGSVFRAVVADDQLIWTQNGRLIFPWEKDGWTHLYSITVSGASTANKATLLTPGEFDVEDVSLSAQTSEVLYSSNQNDIDRRHLWRVSVSGSEPKPITNGNGIEWSPVLVMNSSGTIAYFNSDARRPAHVSLISGSNTSSLETQMLPSDFPSSQLVEPQQVIFTSPDGMKIHAQLFQPSNVSTGKRYPAVVFFHGGSRRQMLLGWHYRPYYHNAYALNQYLASRGFIVLSVNYRSGIGYGMEFREALKYGATGASEFNDVLGAGNYLRARTDVDPHRIGLWGGSYGGYLTALGLARASDMFAAGVDFHGVHDWNTEIRNFVPAYDPK